MPINKARLAQHLHDEMGLNKREAGDLVDLFFEGIKDALERGEPVKLYGFGNYVLRDKKSRPGRNPKTGIETTVKARRVVTFKLGVQLKARVDNNAATIAQSFRGGLK